MSVKDFSTEQLTKLNLIFVRVIQEESNIKKKKDLQDELVLMNMGLVNMVLKEHQVPSWLYEDFYEAGLTGLVKAARYVTNGTFNLSRNVKFSTYATKYIFSDITKARKSFVNLGDSLDYVGNDKENFKNVAKIENTPSDFDLEEDSIDKIENYERIAKVENALKKISPKIARVIKARYFSGAQEMPTFEDIGKEMNCSRQRVDQLEKRGIQNLIEILEEEKQSGVKIKNISYNLVCRLGFKPNLEILKQVINSNLEEKQIDLFELKYTKKGKNLKLADIAQNLGLELKECRAMDKQIVEIITKGYNKLSLQQNQE